MNEEELKQEFHKLVGPSETKWKVFCLFGLCKDHNYKEVASTLNIQKSFASACLADLHEIGLLETETYGKYVLNGKNLPDALSNAISLEASKLNSTAINLKIAAEAV